MKTMKPHQRSFAGLRQIRLLLAAVCSAVLAWGASTQVWEISAYNDFLAGKFENLSLDPDGRLKLGPALENVFASEQPLIWAVAVASDGTIYAGTGHEGRVYRITPDGKSDVFWKAPEIEVFALAIGPAGALYAATSPNGKVYRLSADGKAEVFFDPKETYIWSLAFAPVAGSTGGSKTGTSSTLFAGTGDQGKIYKVEAANQGEVYFETQQRHVVSLAFDGAGRLLAGTDPNGVLYRVEAKDDIRARLGRSPDYADALAISLAPELERSGKKFIFG
jgi:outer membrane protein assembly factor BamB